MLQINNARFFIILMLVLTMAACKEGPKVIAPSSESSPSGEQMTAGAMDAPDLNNSIHTVTVKEVIPGDQYTYAKVAKEDGEEYWLASAKQELDPEVKYFYQGGLLQTDFESKELNRKFDKIILVDRLIAAGHMNMGGSHMGSIDKEGSARATVPDDNKERNIVTEGSTRIKDLVENKEKYDGKEVRISGEVVKVNEDILGTNWLHLKDGSMDEFDLVVTCESTVREGDVVTISGVVALDKDFGSGYVYDLIVEEATLLEEM